MSIDPFIVSFSYGLCLKGNRTSNSIKLGLATGLGQFIMPVLGWYGAELIHGYIEAFDHWLALLSFWL